MTRLDETSGVRPVWELSRPVTVRRSRRRARSASAERLLLEQFLSARTRDAGRAIISLNHETIISNAAAAPLVDDVGQAQLWQHAAQTLAGGPAQEGTITLATGRTLATRCQRIGDGETVVGALVEVEAPPSAAAPAPELVADPPWALPGLAGGSAAWRAVASQARAYATSRLPLLVEGETGVGKLALVESMFAEARAQGLLSVFDAGLEPVEGAARWITALRAALDDPRRVVVVRHLEALEDDAAQALASLIETFEARGTRFVGTLTHGERVRRPHPRLVDRFAVLRIEIPPLHDRGEDLEPVLDALTRRHASSDVPPRWLPEAVHALAREQWPANVRELENLVRRVVATTRARDVGLQDLPDELRQEPRSPALSYLQRVELDALVTALRRAGGNKVEAASMLGISRATLYRKIRTFGLDAERAVA